MAFWFFWSMFVFVSAQRVSELFLSKRNTKIALAKGAVEKNGGHYPLFFVLHISWMVSWTIESLFGGEMSAFWPFWTVLFLLAEGIRYWAIFTLGENWNTRIFVIPGNVSVRKGPYRFLKHPNYAAVALEIFSLPMIFNSYWTAAAFSILNALLLLLIRIPAENAARKTAIN